MFGLRRLRGNPPRSLWLQHIHRMCCLTRRAHTAVPPLHKFEGTHGVRFAWGNTDAIDFVAIASSLQATNGRRAVGNTNRLKAVPLVHGRKKPHSPVHLYYPSSSALATVAALRLRSRSKFSKKSKFIKKRWFFQEYFIKNMAIDNKVLKI